jgi:hypothetical protein
MPEKHYRGKEMPSNNSRNRSRIVKSNLSPLMVGIVALVSPTLSFTIIQTIIPYSVTSAQAMPSGPDFSRLSLSPAQDKQLRNIQLEMKPKILAILTPTQQEQLEANLGKGKTLWRGLTSLDLSKEQQSKVQSIMKSQRFKIVKILTPEQRSQLMRSGKPPF